MANVLTEAYLRRADLVFLVTVDYAGQLWRFSTRRLEVFSGGGHALAYEGGIDDLDFTEDCDWLSDAPAQRSLSLDLLWPGVAELVALGHDLASARGELAVIRPGDDLEDRIVLLVGEVEDPQYGDNQEPVSFTLAEDAFRDTTTIPTDAQVVSEETWTDPGEADTGAPYPVVFGRPGRFRLRNGYVFYTTGSPALWVDTATTAPTSERYVLVAGHATQAGEGGTVALYNDAFKEWSDCACSHARDALGRVVTLADVTTLAGRATDLDGDGATDPWTADHQLWAEWPNDYALMCHDRASPVKGAGDLLAWVLAQSGARVDWGRVSAARDFLNRFELAGYIDEPTGPMEWLRSNLLPLLPVSMMASAEGIYPLVWRWDATARDAVASIVVGRDGITRVGPVKYEGRDSIVNEVTVRYAQSAKTGVYKRRVLLTPDEGRVGDAGVITSMHAQVSARRYGTRPLKLDTSIVCSTDTAQLIATWKVIATGFARRVVTLDAGHGWGWLRPGDVVTLTEDGTALSDAVALVRSQRWTVGGLAMDVALIEDVARDPRVAQ